VLGVSEQSRDQASGESPNGVLGTHTFLLECLSWQARPPAARERGDALRLVSECTSASATASTNGVEPQT